MALQFQKQNGEAIHFHERVRFHEPQTVQDRSEGQGQGQRPGVAFGLQAALAGLLERIGRRPKMAIQGSSSYNDGVVQPGATALALSEESGLRNSLREGLTASPRRYKRSAGARKARGPFG